MEICKDCNASYIGKMKERLKEHKKDVRRKNDESNFKHHIRDTALLAGGISVPQGETLGGGKPPPDKKRPARLEVSSKTRRRLPEAP